MGLPRFDLLSFCVRRNGDDPAAALHQFPLNIALCAKIPQNDALCIDTGGRGLVGFPAGDVGDCIRHAVGAELALQRLLHVG